MGSLPLLVEISRLTLGFLTKTAIIWYFRSRRDFKDLLMSVLRPGKRNRTTQSHTGSDNWNWVEAFGHIRWLPAKSLLGFRASTRLPSGGKVNRDVSVLGDLTR